MRRAGCSHLARGLRTAPATAAALAAGEINVEQAHAVVETLHALPDDVDAEVAGQVEQAMLEHAEVLDAAGLRVLGARALAHVAPEVGRRGRPQGPGGRRGAGAAAPWPAPVPRRHRRGHRAGQPRPGVRRDRPGRPGPADQTATGRRRRPGRAQRTATPRRRADRDLPQRCSAPTCCPPPAANPSNSSSPPASTRSPDSSGVGMLDTGVRLSPGVVRRLACDAVVLPAILGGAEPGPRPRPATTPVHRRRPTRPRPQGRRMRFPRMR